MLSRAQVYTLGHGNAQIHRVLSMTVGRVWSRPIRGMRWLSWLSQTDGARHSLLSCAAGGVPMSVTTGDDP
jgi:hypothetical protein